MTNFTLPLNVSNYTGLAQYVGSVTDGVFWGLFALTVGVVVFFVVYYKQNYNPGAALVGASFAFFLTVLFLTSMGLLGISYFTGACILLLFSVFGLILSRDRTM